MKKLIVPFCLGFLLLSCSLLFEEHEIIYAGVEQMAIKIEAENYPKGAEIAVKYYPANNN